MLNIHAEVVQRQNEPPKAIILGVFLYEVHAKGETSAEAVS